MIDKMITTIVSLLWKLLGVNKLSKEMHRLSNNLSNNLSISISCIEDSINLIARRDNTLKRIRVVFLVHHASSWPATLPVVRAMFKDHNFEPLVFSLPHIAYLDTANPLIGETIVHEMLDDQSIPHFRIMPENISEALSLIKVLNPCLIFRQDPWETSLPQILSSQRLSFTRLCYIPYGYMAAAIQKHQFDMEFHRRCWRIFCPDEMHKQLYKKYNLLGDAMCVVTGYPKYDELLSCDKPFWPLANTTDDSMYRIVWAPHHSLKDDWLNFGDFENTAPVMLNLAKSYSNVQIVLRPHPVFTERVDSLDSPSSILEFLSEWNKLPNTAYSREPEYAGLFLASDLLVTDGVSFLNEYQLFDKPLIFIERRDIIGFNEAGQQFLTGLYRITDYSKLESLILKILSGWEDSKIAAARKTNLDALRPFPGKAADNILQAILDGFNNDRFIK